MEKAVGVLRTCAGRDRLSLLDGKSSRGRIVGTRTLKKPLRWPPFGLSTTGAIDGVSAPVAG